MKDGRSPRIHLSLTIWTLLLIGLVLVEIRHLPAGLTVLLVPYLTLMAWDRMHRLRWQDDGEPDTSHDVAAGSPLNDELDERADSPGPADRSGCDDCPLPAPPRPTEEQVTPPSRRGRARRRSRTPEGEPLAASWVEVRPGRFVRVDEMAPEHPPGDSRTDDARRATFAERAVIPEAGSIPEATGAEVSGSEIGASHPEMDTVETVVPDDRENGERGVTGSLVTTTYLIGCPSGDPEGPGVPLRGPERDLK
jgi:hypothetical protein